MNVNNENILTFEDALYRALVTQQEQASPPRNSNVVYVTELPPDANEHQLKILFLHQEPQLLSIEIVNQYPAYGIVTFESPEAAAQAVELLGGEYSQVLLPPDNKKVVITYSRTAHTIDLDDFNLYMGSIPNGTTETQIRAYLKKLWDLGVASVPGIQTKIDMGSVIINIPKDPVTRQDYGYAFIQCRIKEAASAIIGVYEEFVTQNEPIEFEPGVVPTLKELSPRPPVTLEGEQPLTKAEAANWSNTTLCAMGLPDNITEKDIRECFGRFGEISSIRISIMKHMAFIRFNMNVSALAAMTELEGTTAIKGRPLRLLWARAKNPCFIGTEGIAADEAEQSIRERKEAELWRSSLNPVDDQTADLYHVESLSHDEKLKWIDALTSDLRFVRSAKIIGLDHPPPPPPV